MALLLSFMKTRVSGATEKMRGQALDAVREHGVADTDQLDALRRSCIDAARTAIAAA